LLRAELQRHCGSRLGSACPAVLQPGRFGPNSERFAGWTVYKKSQLSKKMQSYGTCDHVRRGNDSYTTVDWWRLQPASLQSIIAILAQPPSDAAHRPSTAVQADAEGATAGGDNADPTVPAAAEPPGVSQARAPAAAAAAMDGFALPQCQQPAVACRVAAVAAQQTMVALEARLGCRVRI